METFQLFEKNIKIHFARAEATQDKLVLYLAPASEVRDVLPLGNGENCINCTCCYSPSSIFSCLRSTTGPHRGPTSTSTSAKRTQNVSTHEHLTSQPHKNLSRSWDFKLSKAFSPGIPNLEPCLEVR